MSVVVRLSSYATGNGPGFKPSVAWAYDLTGDIHYSGTYQYRSKKAAWRAAKRHVRKARVDPSWNPDWAGREPETRRLP